MRTPPRARLGVAAAVIATALCACQPDEVRTLRWEIDFADDALRARAAIVEGRILEGGCTSMSVRFAAEAGRGDTPEAPPRLDAGRYGFEARARDASCVWFASSCVEIDVPRSAGDVVVITLEAVAGESPACPASMCSAGRCGVAPGDAGIDARPPGADAGDGGAACGGDAECGECMACVAGACVAGGDGDACGAGGTCRGGACCAGCWAAGSCAAGDVVTACGAGGVDCAACSGATPYCDGACVGPRTVVDVAVGAASACAVAGDGTLWCWGSNLGGQLGVGTSGMGTESTTPQRIGSDVDWADVGMGDDHVCGVRTGGALWCWGDAEDGQIGTGAFADLSVPGMVDAPGVWTEAVGGNGGDHTCALRDDGTLWCMGQNDYGQLGLGDNVDHTALAQIAGAWRAVAAGHHATCAIRADGTLWCWGENTNGQLAQGTSGAGLRENVPQQVGIETDWTAIAMGDAHGCGVRAAGELHCWGLNGDGQLGIDSTTLTPVVTRVGTFTNWQDVSAGMAHTCAIRGDGSLWCWGRNDAGQLGLGTSSTTDLRTPQRVGTTTGWAQVRAGDLFTCGLRDDRAYCWGSSSLGQLGQGDRLSRSIPTEVLLPRP